MADLDFVKLTAHPEYTQKEPMLDGVPVELSGPLQKDGESGSYVISESLAAIDGRVLEAAGRVAGEIGNVVCVKVSDQEYQALSKHLAYDYQPDRNRVDRKEQSLAPHFCGRLERRGQNILLISESRAAANAQRMAEIRAENLKRLDAMAEAERTHQQVEHGESSPVPTTPEPTAPAIRKPASWWSRFIFPGTPLPKADAILALRLVLGELRITVGEEAFSFQTDPVMEVTFTSTLEQVTGSDLGWRTLVQIYEREKQRADH